MDYPGLQSKPFKLHLSGDWFQKGDVLSTGGTPLRVLKVYRRRWWHRWLREIVWFLYNERIFPDWTGQMLKVKQHADTV